MVVKMDGRDIWNELADLFKVFGDSSRIRILYKLQEGEMCVQDIAEGLLMTQSAVSHQLKILKMSKLVKNRRDGKMVYYSLDDDHVSTILSMGKEHLEEQKTV
ncbi:MAG: winged helix-turn-helix transcriptional regulator [Lachnospiraceae bacterium]|jgi:ArsR family transcriptional regulator|nr:winged helix-turn-helix transcriptional regulator [Lachnospiraceae bacterium]MBR1451081.1 winged helix-turn-helix transcriptional regulator [Lachnospiraceae bacterium]